MTVTGAEHFVKILKKNKELIEVIPWGREIINLHELISQGCKCKKGAKERMRDETYRELVTFALGDNDMLCAFIKKELSSDEVIFMLRNEEILKI